MLIRYFQRHLLALVAFVRRFRSSYLVFGALLYLFAAYASASGGLRFEHVMTESGISVAETNAIAQDHQGFIWVGGSNGLARYDGQEFKLFLHDPQNLHSLSSNYVWDILVDHKGDLWVATTGGLNRFNPLTETFERFLKSTANPASIISNDIYTLFEDTGGRLWVGTRQGLDRFDESSRGFRHYRHSNGNPKTLSSNSITAIFQNAEGELWVGTQNGLNKFNEAEQSFELFEFGEKGFYDKNLSVRSLEEDAQGNFWVGTDSGLFRFNFKSTEAAHYVHIPGDKTSLSDNRVWKLMLDDQDNIWVSTDRGGLNKFSIRGNGFERYNHDPLNDSSLGGDQVREIFQDTSGDYWVALFPSGVDYANHTASVFSVYQQDISDIRGSLGNDVIASVASAGEGRSWVGTEGGLYLFDANKETFQAFVHDAQLPSSIGAGAVLAITEDSQGRFWFGTWSGGLNLYIPETNTFKQFLPKANDPSSISSPYIWSLLGDSKGNVWVGTESGALDVYSPKTDSFTHFVPNALDPNALSGGFIRAIVEDSQGVIWVATINGLNRFNTGDQTFTRFQNKPGDGRSLPHNSVASIFEDSDRRLWVGTEGGGLALMDRDSGTFTSYGIRDGLSNGSVMGIAEDSQGLLWLNTLRGLNRYNPSSESFSSFTDVNGLAGSIMNRPAIHFDDDGFMIVGSTKGLTRFNPGSIKGNENVPPVVLTSFKIFNQEVALGGGHLKKHIQYTSEVVLGYQETMFSFGFAALNYRNPSANQYAYYLEGFDKQWINVEQGQGATYTSLGPGRYTFKVKASNNNGVWNDDGHSLNVVILPPPWRTWWAYTLYCLVLLGSVYGFVCVQKRKFEFEKQKVAQLRAIDKVKDEFLANTSHELRTPLNGIIGLTESLIDDPKAEMSDQVRTYLKMVAGSGRRLSNLINDILDFSKLKNNGIELKLAPVDLKSVCDSVCVMIKPLADKKDLQIINSVPDGLPSVLVDEDRLQQVLYNLIGNAIKFTPTGSVKIYTETERSCVAILIEDTGVGISEADINSIFESFTQGRGDAAREYEGTGLGLAVAKDLIELHGGEIGVESEVGRGSVFRFTLRVTDTSAPQRLTNKPQELVTRINTIVSDMSESEGELVVTESPNREQYKFHILVVDDDEINREVLMSQLSLHDYRISQAVNGSEAVEAVRSDESIDMVLLDVMMPRMTGYEAAEKIRAIKPVHELPIIFITAKHLASDLVAGFIAGGNDFLIKPISKNELLSRTKTHLLLLDVTRNLENIVEERTEILRKTQHSLEVIDHIVHLINKEDSLDGLARILLKESALLLANVDVGALWMLNDSGKSFEMVATHGGAELHSALPSHISRRQLFATGSSSLHRGVQLLSAKDVTFITDAEGDIESLLVMIIESEDVLAGLLIFANRKGTVFTNDDISMLSRIETHAVSAVSKAKMLAVLKKQNEKLEKISYTDQLTKLNNRRHLVRYLQGDLALCLRRYEAYKGGAFPAEADLLFLMIDLDFFKAVNDNYGHNAGDIILKEFSDKMRAVFRESDHLIRWGGEEFLVVIRFAERSSALSLVERFRNEVEQMKFDVGGGVILKKTCSIGYSIYPFHQNSPQAYTWEQVVEVADKCLYIAKTSQRNAWVGVCGNPDSKAMPDFASVTYDLKENVEKGHLLLGASIEDKDKLKW